MGRLISKAAFKFSMDNLAENCKLPELYFWTFTFREVLDVDEAKHRWSLFLRHRTQGLVPSFPSMSGIRTFEMHPGKDGLSHGLHIHAVVDCFLPVDIVRLKWYRFAGENSRIHVKKIAKDAAHYIGKYLNKQRDGALGNARLWATFGKADATRCKDIVITSEFTATYAFLKSVTKGFDKMTWGIRIMLCNRFMQGCSIEAAMKAAGLRDDYWQQVKAEHEYFANMSKEDFQEYVESMDDEDE